MHAVQPRHFSLSLFRRPMPISLLDARADAATPSCDLYQVCAMSRATPMPTARAMMTPACSCQ